ncbi:MAG: FHA domain-containing protein, partial [Planctomycetaceae bacterium]
MNLVNRVADFAAACGQRAPIRIRVFNSRSGDISETQIDKPYALVGTDPKSDIRLNDPEISRVHAYLQVIDGRMACIDLDSRTGVHFGKTSRPRGWLTPGQSIHLGPFMLTLIGSVGDDTAAETEQKFSSWDSPGGPTAPFVLSFLNAHSRTGQKRVCRMIRRVTLAGWSDVCNLRLQHHSVERVQCGFVAAANDLWVVDLRSETGVEVNEELLECCRLKEKDRVRLGKFHLSVAPAAAGSSWPEDEREMADATEADDEESVDRQSADAPARDAGRSPGRRVRRKKSRGLIPAGGLRPASDTLPSAPVPASAAVPAVGEAGTVALLQHFESMQQQYMNHTQQMMSMVVQAFSAAHSRQLDVIRDELQRVHELNRELQELQARR